VRGSLDFRTVAELRFPDLPAVCHGGSCPAVLPDFRTVAELRNPAGPPAAGRQGKKEDAFSTPQTGAKSPGLDPPSAGEGG